MKICCIFNYNPLYRLPIYHAIDSEFDCDFYFGKQEKCTIKAFDPSLLRGFKGYIYPKRINNTFSTYKGIKLVLKKEYTHYIITGEPFYVSNWIILFYALIHKKRIFFWTHGTYTKISKSWTRVYNRLFYSHADLLLYGEHAGMYMEELGCKKERMHYIHNSLDTNVQTVLYEMNPKSRIYEEHFHNTNPIVIYIGRIQKRKKVDQLIEAIHILKRKGVYVNVVIVGPETDEMGLVNLVKQYRMENQVWFYGPSYDEKTNSILLYNADCCVSPGNVGLTSIHALTYGTPVITNDNFDTQMPEFEAIQPGLTGDFFKENDVNDLSLTIERWISVSPNDRVSIREIARKKIINEWSVQYQIDLLKRVIK